jgi:hypothetical protein
MAGGECEACGKNREETLQRKAADSSKMGEAPAIVREVLRSPGQPLDATTRAFMEPRFGHDFSAVRVHTDAKAAESATAVNALAYTIGRNVVFGEGRYAPGTQSGLRLLAHELTHTVQQNGLGLRPSLEIGRLDDPGEREADRIADAVVGGATAPPLIPASGPALLRRTPDEPEPLRADIAHLPATGRGEGAHIQVIRKLMPCACRKVPDAREGVFWNPDLDAFAIAYRHCRGGVTSDVYGEVESNLSSFLAGGPPPTGTARIGFEINVVGRNVSGRALLEVLGSNVSGSEGVGGRAQVVFQGGQWRVFVTSDFLHRMGASAGDVLNLDLGSRLGPITVEVQISDMLSSAPLGKGAGCFDIFGGSARLCGALSAGGGGGVAFGPEIRGPFGGQEARPDEDCFQCLCPPPTKHFKCYLDIPPTERPVTREIEIETPHEYRYYFRVNETTPSEAPFLQDRSKASLEAAAGEVAAGGRVVKITGYASPEAIEAHNDSLSADRAETLTGLLSSSLKSPVRLPEPSAGGELLGRRPAPSPSSRLGDVIRAEGFRSAEDISVRLSGEEIPNSELTDQLVSLFQALPEAADRLALFGLAPSDPLARRVLSAVDEFLRRPHVGPRPWEQVFQLLRVGVVSTSRSERRTVTETERTPSSFDELSEDECQTRGVEAERGGLLPPIPRELQSPRRGREDRNVECDSKVKPEDRIGGCSYEIPPEMRLSPRAPARAPRPFP